jgi:Na+/proline symporter
MNHPLIHNLSPWDYLIIVCYFAFVLSIGWLFRRSNKNASDYFRGGGNMLWWVAGMSVMASGISTWTFTGGAAKCYHDGFVLPVTYWLAGVPSLLVALWAAPKMRRFRVITAIEAVFRRFGGATEQFYTWTMLPFGVFIGAVGLNTLAVFMASTFHAALPVTIATLGVIVTVMSTLGGQWGVSAGAFVQGLMMLLIVAVVVVLSVNLPEIGGPAHLLQVLPPRHLKFNIDSRTALIAMWIGWQTFTAALGPLDIRGSGKFVRAKDEGHVRKMVLLMSLPSILLMTPIWMQLPAMCAAVVFPDMHAIFPNLSHPEEAAWVAMSFKVLPQGLLGVLVCGMFAAAIDSLDAALNTNSGFFVRNVYVRFLRPDATDKQQLRCGKIATVSFGVLMVFLGLQINAMRTLNLFDFLQLMNAVLLTPMVTPMIMGLIVKRTPPWSGWSTVIAGLVTSTLAARLYSPVLIQHLFGYRTPLSPRESTDSQFIFVSVLTMAVSVLWFLATARFYAASPEAFKAQIVALDADLAEPVDRSGEPDGESDLMQYRMIGQLCASMGGFFAVCVAIPNPPIGRIIFAILAAIIGGLGLCLLGIYRRLLRGRQTEASFERLPALKEEIV